MREPDLSRARVTGADALSNMLCQQQRMLYGLSLMRQSGQQDFEPHEYTVFYRHALDANLRGGAVSLQVIRAIAECFANRLRITHRHIERAQDLRALLCKRESHAEIGALQLERRAFEQLHHRAVRNNRIAIVENRGVDSSLAQKRQSVPTQTGHQAGKITQCIDAYDQNAFGGGVRFAERQVAFQMIHARTPVHRLSLLNPHMGFAAHEQAPTFTHRIPAIYKPMRLWRMSHRFARHPPRRPSGLSIFLLDNIDVHIIQ